MGGEETGVINSCEPIGSQRSEWAQWVRVIAAKPDSLMAETHMLGGENRLLPRSSLTSPCPLCGECVGACLCGRTCVSMSVCMHTRSRNKWKRKGCFVVKNLEIAECGSAAFSSQQRQAGLHEFKASLVYIVSSRQPELHSEILETDGQTGRQTENQPTQELGDMVWRRGQHLYLPSAQAIWERQGAGRLIPNPPLPYGS